MIRKILKEFKVGKEDELKNKLRFLAASNIDEEIRTRECMKKIDAFKEKFIGIKELIIGTINYDCNRLLTGLNFKEKLIVKKVRLIETKLKRQNVSERIIDTIKISLFNKVSNECYGLYDLYLD